MLIRQKIILALLAEAKRPLSRTVFVKLVFFLRLETSLNNSVAFYDFVPYKYGPFSFTLYRELVDLKQNGYLKADEEWVALNKRTSRLTKEKIAELPLSMQQAVGAVIRHYGGKIQSEILHDLYERYPWFTIKSELTELRAKTALRMKKARPAVYTAGYEGKSVDAFFNHLIKEGIKSIIDVRANPISRRYGFSKTQFCDISNRLGLEYLHIPVFGIPSKHRVDLTDYESYQRLLRKYERETLPELEDEIEKLGIMMRTTPAVLVCFEKDVHCCHRGRLAEVISSRTGLEVVHL